MYKKILSLLSCLLVLMATKCNKPKKEYFEGEVHFKITSKSLDNRMPSDILEMETGNTMIGKVKRNKYMMYQNTGGELGTMKMILLLEEGIGYTDYEKSDTIIQFSIESNPDKLINQQLNEYDKKVILGDTCQSITFKYLPKINFGVIEYVEAKHYFNPKYKLDKNMYAKHEMSFWNKFVKMSKGGISVRNEITNYPLYSITTEAIKIIEKNISDNEFEIDKSKIVKMQKED